MTDILELSPVKEFVKAAGKDIEAYFGNMPGAIIYLRPDGVFYGEGLYAYLKRKKKDVVLTSMKDDGEDLDDEKVRGRKVLIVDNDIVSGKGYKKAMEAMRLRKSRLGIKDIRFGAYLDRVGLADFYVEQYSAEAIWDVGEVDAVDLKIVKYLTENGRAPLAEMGQKLSLSPVAIKNRMDKLIKEKILRIQGLLNIEHFYNVSAHLDIKTDKKTIDQLIGKFEGMQEVYHMRKPSGGLSLTACVLAKSLRGIDEFVEREIRSFPSAIQIEVKIGELPIIPKVIVPKA